MKERLNRLGVAICGAGHSGSTLLGLVLGSHSRCFYAGEAKKTLFLNDSTKPLRKRVCKLCGPGCPIWSRFDVPPSPDVYEQISRLTGRSIVVDSTKKVDWIRARARELAAAGVEQRRVFIARDGRAVVNSRLRKYPDRTPRQIVDAWVEQIRSTEALLAERPGSGLRIRYEELATEPDRVVRDVCTFLGLEFEPSMLRYERMEHHPLGGNTGTQSVVARASEVDGSLSRVPARSRAYYGALGGGFRLDLRWKTELPAEVLRVFEQRAAVVNGPFRWE